jgi:hypothetical protein
MDQRPTRQAAVTTLGAMGCAYAVITLGFLVGVAAAAAALFWQVRWWYALAVGALGVALMLRGRYLNKRASRLAGELMSGGLDIDGDEIPVPEELQVLAEHIRVKTSREVRLVEVDPSQLKDLAFPGDPPPYFADAYPLKPTVYVRKDSKVKLPAPQAITAVAAILMKKLLLLEGYPNLRLSEKAAMLPEANRIEIDIQQKAILTALTELASHRRLSTLGLLSPDGMEKSIDFWLADAAFVPPQLSAAGGYIFLGIEAATVLAQEDLFPGLGQKFAALAEHLKTRYVTVHQNAQDILAIIRKHDLNNKDGFTACLEDLLRACNINTASGLRGVDFGRFNADRGRYEEQ